MPNPLNDFSLLHVEIQQRRSLMPIQAFLTEQARFLGIHQIMDPHTMDSGDIAFTLQHSMLSPIRGRYTSTSRWLPLSHHSELLLQAASGVMSVHGRASGKAQPLGVNYLSALTSAMALQGTLAAAIGQLRGGQFHEVGTSPLGCSLLSIGQYLASATVTEDREHILPGAIDPMLHPPFQSSEGIAFELETLDSIPWRRFWEIAGLSPEVAGAAWTPFLLRYAKAITPLPAACLNVLRQVPYERTRQWGERAGVAVVPVRSVADRQRDPDYLLSRGNPWHFAAAPAESERSLPSNASAQLPLRGLRVIESCRRIQGPLAGHLLALLGAEVIRLEPLGGDPLRAMPPCADGCSVRFDALNQLKIVHEVDFKSRQGRQLIYELTREADVFLHNWAPGKARALLLDAEHLHAIQPQLVYAYAGGWGSARVSAPGTDFTVQAWSGVASLIATASNTRGGTLFTALDVLGGVIAALGISAALLQRAVVGKGTYIESSLLGAADILTQAGTAASETDALSAVYPTKSGLIAIDCPHPEQRDSLALLLGITAAECICTETISQRLRSRPAPEWEALLTEQGVYACVVIENLSDLSSDIRVSEYIGQKAYSFVKSPWSFL